VAKIALVDCWGKLDTADIGTQEPNDQVTPTFLRDLQHGNHFLVDEQGNSIQCESGRQFVDFIDPDTHPANLPMVVSHLANQKLGLFVRALMMDNVNTPLKTSDGEGVYLQMNPKVSYRFRKLDGGKIELAYEARIDPVQGVKRHSVGPGPSGYLTPTNRATFQLNMRIVIEPDGQWEIENPRIQATNLHQFG
jgi:hypothetical protein